MKVPPHDLSLERGIRVLLVVTVVVVIIASASAEPTTDDAEDEAHIVPQATAVHRASERPLFKSNVDLVLVNVTVIDSHDRLVSGLDAKNFSLLEDNRPQLIKYFSSEDSPISLTILLDASGSMSSHIDEARKAAIEFFRASNPRDELTVISFSEAPHLLIDAADSPGDIEAKLMLAEAGGRTALWDALYFAVERMRHARYSRKALLLISDGGDNQSRYTEGEVKTLLEEADTQMYAINIFERYPKTPEERTGLLMLDEVTSVTGGRVFLVHSPTGVDRAVSQISAELRNQYVLGYVPTENARDGKWHRFKVQLDVDDSRKLRSYAKKGYYGPEK